MLMEEWPRVLERAVESTRNGVLITDPKLPDNPIVYANPAFQRITGYSAEEVLGRNCRFLQRDDRAQPALDVVRAAIQEGRGCRVVVRNYRKDGALFWQELSISPVRDDRGQITHFMGIQDDVTERNLAEERLVHQVLHDPLTSLPNRVLFMDRLQEAHSRATSEEATAIAVLFLGLDGFKSVNGDLGHQMGDRVLVSVAERLEECLREEDIVARLGGAEFVILLDGISGAEDASRAAKKISDALRIPLTAEEDERSFKASIGVAVSTAASGHVQPQDLLRSAELSMYRSRREGEVSNTISDLGG